VTSKWSASLYGFVEADNIWDSTESFNDLAGHALIIHDGLYGNSHGRFIMGARNSRIGFKIGAPEFEGIKASAQLEMDFLGNQPAVSEAAFIQNPTFRFRHMNVKLESDAVDVLIGQYWQLFGWQSYFHPATVEIQGVPGQIYSRAPQIRLSKTIKGDSLNIDIALAAAKPPQRDSQTPDAMAGIRATLNNLKAVHTMGSAGTAADGASIGVSGVLRRFDLPQFMAGSTDDNSITGWGFSVDALIPIIPGTMEDRGNALTLTGSFVRGEGIADLYTGLTGGVVFPALGPGMPFTGNNIDNGLVTYDAAGTLHTIDWQSFIVGLQYYLPGGKLFVAGNFSQIESGTAQDFGPKAGTLQRERWADGNLFWDVTPAVRLGLEYAWFNQLFGDGTEATNHRVQFSALYLF
jgi:hypothetical protein